MTRVLLTYAWVRSSYAVLRNLDVHGVDVHVADSFRTGMCQWSRKKTGFDLYPSHYRDEVAFVAAIKRICADRSIELIFPSHNETEILARHKESFPGTLGALLPDPNHCAMFNSKAASYDHAIAAGVPVPQRVTYDAPENVLHRLRDAGLSRSVIKLLTGNSSKGVFYAGTPEEAQAIVQRLISQYQLAPGRYPQVEEYVSGDGWGSSVLYWQGRKIAGFTHRRLREKIASGGTSTLREACLHPGLEDAAEKIFSNIGWHGHAMAEFKVCPATGKFWFIEVNPRLWGSIPLAIDAGVEFPYLAWLCATQGAEAALAYHATRSVKQPWRNRWLLGDLMLSAKEILHLRLGEAMKILFRSGANATDDVFWDDPLVFPGEVARYCVGAISSGSMNAAEEGMVR